MPERPTSDGRRQRREEIFVPQPADGALRGADGLRTAAVPLALMQELRLALGQNLGDGTRHLLYCIGFDWSLRDMVHLGQRLRGDSDETREADLWQLDRQSVLEAWWAPLAAAGWGTSTFSPLRNGLVLAQLDHSAPAAAAGRTTETACHLCAGLFAGALSFLERAERHAVEIECAALGHASCQFIAGASPAIDSVEAWKQQRLTAADIIRRLGAGDSPVAT